MAKLDRTPENIIALKRGIQRLRYTDVIAAATFQEAASQGLNYTQTLELALIVMTEAKDNAQQVVVKKLQNIPYPVGLEFPKYVEPRYVRELFSKE